MIIVFGAVTMDMVLQVGEFPQPGQAVLSPAYEMDAGGKGANQALAAARTGAKTALVGRVGDDGMGLRILNGLRRDGVMTSGVVQSEQQPTGISIVMINDSAEREIVTAIGANAEIANDQVPDEILIPKNMLLLQMEIPASENWALLERAEKNGAMTILNLGPAINIPQSALEKLDYLVVNQVEARQIGEKLGVDVERNIEKLAHALSQKGNLTCIVTLGAQGSVAVTPDGGLIRVPAFEIENVVDRTGAGDAYCGTLAGMLHEGMPLPEAMRHASVAASLTCAKRGGQSSFPYVGDIQDSLPKMGQAAKI